LPTGPFPEAAAFVDADNVAPEIEVDGIDNSCAKAFGNPVSESVKS